MTAPDCKCLIACLRSLEDDTIVALDGKTNRLLQFENSRESKSVAISADVFAEHQEVDLRYDLIDCHIDICSPEVQDFTELFWC